MVMRDAEFDLLVTACGASFKNRPIDAPAPAVGWERLLALAGRHRVQALCWDALGAFADEMPREVAAKLQAQARDIVVANLKAAAECERLHKAFAAAGVPLLFLKGLTLAATAYRQPWLKMGVDIDLLTAPERLADATRILRSANYLPVTPAGADDHGLGLWHASHKESVWAGIDRAFQIDLHTRLADHPAMLADLSANSPAKLVSVATGITLPTLNNDDLFAYLCVHGASSAWFRLKWITDLAALLAGQSESGVERLYEKSQQLGAGRSASQALLLADWLYSIGIGRSLRSRLLADPMNCWLVGVAEGQLRDAREPTERPFGTAMIHVSQLGLRPGWRFKVSEASRQIRNAVWARAM